MIDVTKGNTFVIGVFLAGFVLGLFTGVLAGAALWSALT